MTPETRTLTAAVATIATRIDETSGWLKELSAEARKAERERTELRIAANRLLAVMPAEARPKARRLLANVGAPVAPPDRPRYGAATAAALVVIAAHPRDVITSAELQNKLFVQGLAADARAAARLLARLAVKGIVERTGRGRYRIDRTHPRLAGPPG